MKFSQKLFKLQVKMRKFVKFHDKSSGFIAIAHYKKAKNHFLSFGAKNFTMIFGIGNAKKNYHQKLKIFCCYTVQYKKHISSEKLFDFENFSIPILIHVRSIFLRTFLKTFSFSKKNSNLHHSQPDCCTRHEVFLRTSYFYNSQRPPLLQLPKIALIQSKRNEIFKP